MKTRQKLEQIKKELRIINQINSRLVTSHEQQPILRMNKAVEIEVVQKNPMVYSCFIEDLPTPIRLNIQYVDKDIAMKDTHLQVTCQFHPFDDKQRASDEVAGTAPGKHWSKTWSLPQKIVIHTLGDKSKSVEKLLSKRPCQVKHSSYLTSVNDRSKGGSKQAGSLGPRTTAPGREGRAKHDHTERFTEQNLYVKFSSIVGCSIQCTLEQPKSRANQQKEHLRDRQAAMR